jgi:glycerate 2-kinase
MKKIVICPDSFKESMDARKVCNAIEEGIKAAHKDYEFISVPMADGGEGTLDVVLHSSRGERQSIQVSDPLRRPIMAEYGIIDQMVDGKKESVVLIESAKIIGLDLLKENERNPAITTTYGIGEMILHALDKGIRRFIIAIGGSSTNDGGSGILRALGIKFLDQTGREIKDGGLFLKDTKEINVQSKDTRLKECEFTILSDVNNTLCGDQGASMVFSMQKGASIELAKQLDQSLCHFANLIKDKTGINLLTITGGGAAGGLAAGLIPFTKVHIKSGAEELIQILGLEETIKTCNLVITGEGKMDSQSDQGKVVGAIAKVAKAHNKPCLVLCGALGKGYEKLYDIGVTSAFASIPGVMSFSELKPHAYEYLKEVTRNIFRLMEW